MNLELVDIYSTVQTYLHIILNREYKIPPFGPDPLTAHRLRRPGTVKGWQAARALSGRQSIRTP